MVADVGSHPKLEIAHVLTIDMVEYSTLLITEQSRVMGELTRMVKGAARFRQAEAEGKLIRLPTGDGMLLVFFDDPEAPIECAMQIAAAMKNHPDIQLRMGIHSGPVNQIIDVNDRSNVAGAGVDMAQRVMDCGDAGHILLSKRVADDLAPFPRWNPHLHDLGECEVKHGRKISLVNFYTDTIGNPEPPRKCSGAQRKTLRSATALGEVFARNRILIDAAIMLIGALIIGAIVFSRHVTTTKIAPNAKSIAVLPFENLSHDPDNAYFADGIQEELLTRLSKIADLKVISRTSTQRYKSAPDNLREIANQLGVAHILEGTVQKAADQVRVNVQLISAANDSHLWADKYDRKLTDIFAVESEVATKIADTLQAKLTGSEQQAIASRPTEDSDAHQLYLKGRYFWGKQTGADLEKAIDYFHQTIAKDPRYAAAYAGLADCYMLLPFWKLDAPADSLEKARAAAQKALDIDNTLAEAHVSLANVLFLADFDRSAAKRELQRALELNPNYATAHQWLGVTLLSDPREINHAIAEFKRACELDPFSLIMNANLGYAYMLARRYPEAISQLHKTIELDPGYYLSHRCLAQALELSGQLEQAIAEYEKPQEANDERYTLAFRAHVYALKGDREKALQLLNQMKELAQHRKVSAYGFALVYLGLGDKDQAINWLERSYQTKEYEEISLIKVDPFLDPLRGDPRFERLADTALGTARKNSPPQQPESKSIAVLPFENLSHDPDNAYFADGIQEEILTRLSKIADLKVISRTSTQRYKSAPDNLREIANQLGVAHILEGTVQKAADQVRVNVQLINALNDSHLWADKFDRKLTDIFAVESEIAAKIVDTLQAKFTNAEQTAIATRPTEDTEAHQLYLRGRYFAAKRGGENLNKAIDYFNQAIARDPKYALAYAGLADCYGLLPQWSPASRGECLTKAKVAANKALEIDDRLGEAHTSLALVLFDDLNLRESKREFERAIELNPNYAFAHYGFGYTVLPALGELDRATVELRRALDLDPFSVIVNANLGYIYIVARRYPDAIVQLQKTVELDPNFGTTHRSLGEALELSGELDQAIAEYEKGYKFLNDDHALAYLAHAYALNGERANALRLLTQLKELEQRGTVWAFGFAMVYLGLGDKNESINWLERSYRDKEAAKISLIKVEPMLDPLRGEPRFEKLADQVVPKDSDK